MYPGALGRGYEGRDLHDRLTMLTSTLKSSLSQSEYEIDVLLSQ